MSDARLLFRYIPESATTVIHIASAKQGTSFFLNPLHRQGGVSAASAATSCNMESTPLANFRKYLLLLTLYISQFLALSFIISAVPAILRDNGEELENIGWIYLFGHLWALKFLWAPLVDRYAWKRIGHYRGWLILQQSLLILSIIGAAFFDIDSQLGILAIFFFLISLFSATQDIAADALSVTILKPEERGFGNAIQTGGGFVGNFIGGGLALITYDSLGWKGSLFLLAGLTALPLLNILFYKEAPAPADDRENRVGYKDIIRFFRRPGNRKWVPILILYQMAISTACALLPTMLVDIDYSLDRIGTLTNVYGSIASIIGCLAIGSVVQRIGRKWATMLGSVLEFISILGLIPLSLEVWNTGLIYSTAILLLLSYGAKFTVFSTVMMDKS